MINEIYTFPGALMTFSGRTLAEMVQEIEMQEDWVRHLSRTDQRLELLKSNEHMLKAMKRAYDWTLDSGYTIYSPQLHELDLERSCA